MSIHLYDSTVATFLQTLGALEGVLARGADHCREQGIELQDITAARIYPDMLPFSYQVTATIGHSVGALEAVRSGTFNPPKHVDLDYAGLQRAVVEARETLTQVSVDEVNASLGRDVKFQLGDRAIPFTAEGFLLSFSVPNFFFHSSMAYAILRGKGVPLGKRDFMGRLRIKR